jgi:ABC-type sulfate/molybdate transport systems ATPase subunit
MVTHDAEDAFLMADRLAVLHGGTLQQIGPPGELHRRPATVQVAELLGMQNILRVYSCQPCGGHWRCDLGGFELLVPAGTDCASAPGYVGFFSWDVLPAASEDSPEQGINWLRLRVVDGGRRGHEVRLRLAAGNSLPLLIEASWHESVGSATAHGETVEVHIPVAKVHAWPDASEVAERS